MSYRRTIIACYAGNFIQAIVINLTAILFIPLREQYGFSYSQFGLLVLLNFLTQVGVDVLFSKAVDKYGFRIFVVTAHIVCVFGFVLFALAPVLFAHNIFTGLVIATIIFSGAGGLFELLLSPIIEAIPSDEKDKAMSMLHSFYAWGQVAVVVVTTLLVYFGVKWQAIVLMWAAFPLLNTFLFIKCPLAVKNHSAGVMKIRALLKERVFILAFFAIATGGASELIMSQWGSSFMQKGLQLPKIVGDILGMCGFAVTMGVGRLVYGIVGDKLNLHKILTYGSLLAVACYIAAALSPFSGLAVVACALTGICVSLLWPGTLVLAAGKLPLAGASLFALLAAGGDVGASVGPYVTGVVTDFFIKVAGSEHMGLKLGLLCGAVFPLASFLIQRRMRKT